MAAKGFGARNAGLLRIEAVRRRSADSVYADTARSAGLNAEAPRRAEPVREDFCRLRKIKSASS